MSWSPRATSFYSADDESLFSPGQKSFVDSWCAFIDFIKNVFTSLLKTKIVFRSPYTDLKDFDYFFFMLDVFRETYLSKISFLTVE